MITMITMIKHFLYLMFVVAMMTNAAAVVDDAAQNEFASPQDKARYYELVNQLRCLVCQNQTIAESNADLAQDMRAVVRRMINEEQSDAAIINTMVSRYGDFVRYQPPFDSRTALLWLAPFLLVVFALLWLPRLLRTQKPVQLSKDEQAAAESLLANKNNNE